MFNQRSTRFVIVGFLLCGVSLAVFLLYKTQAKNQSKLSVNIRNKPEAEVFELGRKLYISNCKVCHLENGLGRAPEFPPLDGSEWALGSAERMIAILLHGIDGEIVVNNRRFSGTMPPFKDRLTYAKIAAILTYVRNAWGNEASPITVEQVKNVAQRTKGQTRVWSANELLKFKWDN